MLRFPWLPLSPGGGMVTISVGSGTRGSGGALSVLSGRNAVNTGGAFMVERRRRSDHEWCDHHRMISLDAPRDKLKQKAGPFGAAALHDMPSFVVCRGQCNRPVVSESVGCYACLATMGFNGGKEAVTVFLSLSRARVASWRLAPWWLKTNTPSTRIGYSHMALGDRRSERIAARSALGCARGRHPRLGLAVRCGDLALSQKKHAFLYVFHVQPKHPNDVMFVNIKGFRPCLSKKSSYGAPQWTLKDRLMQKERLKSPHKSLFLYEAVRSHTASWSPKSSVVLTPGVGEARERSDCRE